MRDLHGDHLGKNTFYQATFWLVAKLFTLLLVTLIYTVKDDECLAQIAGSSLMVFFLITVWIASANGVKRNSLRTKSSDRAPSAEFSRTLSVPVDTGVKRRRKKKS